MKRRSLLLWLAASACHREAAAELSLAGALSEVARQTGVNEDRVSWSTAEVSRLAALAERELSASRARPPVSVLTELVFEHWGFVREVEDTSLRYVLLPSVLELRRGSCVGLGTLFLALAGALHWSASGVLMPGHFYARVNETAGPRNVELLRGGEAMPNAWYEQRFPIPGGSAREYARPLTTSEVLGVVHFNVGNERMRQRRLNEAKVAFTLATRAFPDMAEAHASLGAVEQLLGDLRAATLSYSRARAANPHLPGVSHNLGLLEGERR